MELINHFYPTDSPLRRLLLHHSRQVADKALAVARRHPELGLDEDLLEAGAMVHDIGILRCDAPGLGCHGPLHYLYHGIAGGELLRAIPAEDWRETFSQDALARFCERHTGTGLLSANFLARGLNVPPLLAADPRALCPEREEECVVCYADKFFSKSHPERTRTVMQTAESLKKFGEEGVKLFLSWAERYE